MGDDAGGREGEQIPGRENKTYQDKRRGIKKDF